MRAAAILGVALALLAIGTPCAAAEWQLKPFIGVTYGSSTTFVDYENAAGHSNFAFGVTGAWLGEIFGVEADWGHAPGFFERTGKFVSNTSTSTLTGNVIVALPRRLAEYTLRPYFVGGAGAIFAHVDYANGDPFIARSLKGMDLGGGVTGFLTSRVGLSWDVRYFRSIDRTFESGISIGPEQLSFWRANMAVAIRLRGGTS
jgi:hypothetical protein